MPKIAESSLEEFVEREMTSLEDQIIALKKFRLVWARGIKDGGWPIKNTERVWKSQFTSYLKNMDGYESVVEDCVHRAERLYSWFAFNSSTGESDIQCVGCCDCGSILKD